MHLWTGADGPEQRSKDNVETLNLIKELGREAEIVVCDLGNDKEVKALTKHVTGSKEEGGLGYSIDILVNCGGIQRRSVQCAPNALKSSL